MKEEQIQLSETVMQILAAAQTLAVCAGRDCVGSEHLLHAMLLFPDTAAGSILRRRGWTAKLWRALYAAERKDRPAEYAQPVFLRRVKQLAGVCASAANAKKVETEHLLAALMRMRRCTAAVMLLRCGDRPPEILREAENASEEGVRHNREGRTDLKLTEQFCDDLLLRADTFLPVVGRTAETEAVIAILCRKCKNNPALIGEPGVGKTAIVEGLARRMAAGDVPAALRDQRLLSLNMASLLAGTKYRGEFEERVRDLIAEIRRSGNIILFVDELHTIVGAGSAEGAIDAANLFKPALGRGELRMIGATTVAEYKKHIEKDAALHRRFCAVPVKEPSPAEAERMLFGLKASLQSHHGVTITEGAVHAAVSLSCRYLPQAFLPDKAIDLLDEAASRLRLRRSCGQLGDPSSRIEIAEQLETAAMNGRWTEASLLRDRLQLAMQNRFRQESPCCLTEKEIAETVSLRTGIAVGEIGMAERERLRDLERSLSQCVLGQPEAVHCVSAAVRHGRLGMGETHRPIASMLFTGPSGVGKTELCKTLARTVYGTAEALIRFDMSEFSERHTVSRLIGAPAGYIGHGEGGELTEKVRRRPYCIVLFDEIEKAHRDFCNLLLQIMDEGVLTDAEGRKTDFSNAVLVMTSNLGSGAGESVGFVRSKGSSKTRACLKEWFSPEFLGRLDCIAEFSALSEEVLSVLAARRLEELSDRVGQYGVSVEYAAEVAPRLAGLCPGESGARGLRAIIRQKVEDPLSELCLSERSSRVVVAVENGTVSVREKIPTK